MMMTGIEVHLAALDQFDRLGFCFGATLKQQRADDGAAQWARGARPLDRRAGVRSKLSCAGITSRAVATLSIWVAIPSIG
jgi:hypothetical protein